MSEYPPVDGADVDFHALAGTDPQDLIDMGCRWWSEEEALMLLPYEWKDDIPGDLRVRSVNGKEKFWKDIPGAPDARFGMLAWGVVVDA